MPNPTLITEWSLLRWLLNNASKALNTKVPWQYLVFWRYLYQGQPVSVNRTQTAAILKGSRVMHSVKRPPSTTRTKVHHLCNIIFCRVAGWEFLEHVHKPSDSSLSGCYSLARVYFWYAVKIYICALTFSDLSLTLWWGPGSYCISNFPKCRGSTEPTVVHFGLAVAELWQSASEAAFSGENLKENSPGVMMVYYGGNGL